MDDYKKQEAPYTTTIPTPTITTTPMNNTIQTTSSWLETIWNLIFTIICSFWDNRLILLRDLIIFAFAIITLYFIYQSYKNQSSTFSNTNTNNNSANASINQPTTFKNTMNIHLWLQDINEYINFKNIRKEDEKKQVILDHLDKDNRPIVKSVIDDQQVKTYKQLEDWLKSFFSSHKQAKTDYLIQFISKYQQPDESFANYYNTLKQLAEQAYPEEDSSFHNKQINEQFIKGIYDKNIQSQLVLVKPADKNTNILHRAVELQNTFQCLNDTSALNAINLSHIANSNTQLHSNNQQQQNVQTRNQQPTYQQHYQTNNTTQNQQPHSRYYNQDNYRPQYQQRNNSNYNTGYNSQNNSPRLRRQNSDIKCNACQQYGHIARNCTQQQYNQPIQQQSINSINATQTGNNDSSIGGSNKQ
jgi:hypothetical protein